MKKILLLLLSASAVSAIAENNGYYVGANIGYANVQGTGKISTNLYNGANGNALGIGINAGYSFNKNLAVEADYLMVPSYSYSDSDAYDSSSASATTKWSDSFLLAAVKGTLPLANNIDLFGKVGAGLSFANADDIQTRDGRRIKSDTYSRTNFAGLLGFGVSYNLNKQVALKLEDDYMITSQQVPKNLGDKIALGNVNFVSLGMEYKF